MDLSWGSDLRDPEQRVPRHAEGVAVVAGQGGLLLEEVQLSGKRAMPAGEFVRGRPDWIGATLGA